jgi:hypothetical protein
MTDEATHASLLDALLVYAEPLASGAHVIVVGDAESGIAERLLDLGARSVHLIDPDPARAGRAARSAPRGVTIRPLGADLEVRDGAFDLGVLPDLAKLEDAALVVSRLERAVALRGAVIALGRARVADAGGEVPFAEDLGPARFAYEDLYALFSQSFTDVTLAGVLPFAGVVFAELGGEGEAPAVSVDTRFAPGDAPSVFVVVARGRSDAMHPLDPYAIVQVPASAEAPRASALELEAAYAEIRLKADLFAAQIEELRERLVVADVRAVEAAARIDRAASERDAALTRAMELEAVLAASQQTLGALERRVLGAEQGVLDHGELVARAERAEAEAAEARTLLEAERDRAERAAVALAAHAMDLTHIAEAHASETSSYEEQLRDRARVIASLEHELARRDQLVRELVLALDEARDGNVLTFEGAVPMPSVREPAVAPLDLVNKLDALALEVARREGELTARGWRIVELENEVARLKARAEMEPSENGDAARLREELEALRQALTQEHAARVAAESGEELSRVRSELARQTALLDQMRGRPS